MKRLFIMLLALALLLTGCSLRFTLPEETEATVTVANPFTQGTTAAPTVSDIFTQPPATDSTTEPSESNSHHSWHFQFVKTIKDDVSAYYEYTGGELHAYFIFEGTDDYSVCGVGPLLYLDGIPQPYKTDEEPWYSYLHVFYPLYHSKVAETGYATSQVFDLYFTPVTGQTGDALEFYCTPVSNPYMDPREGEFDYYLVQHLARDSSARIIFQATPPELELPEVPDQILSHSVTYADEPELQKWTPEQLQIQHAYGYTINGETRPEHTYSWVWHGFDQEPVTLDFYIYGDSYVKYTLICYKDYEPISIDPEDILYVEVKDGQRTNIQVQIDMSDFDGSTPICFMTVLVPLNMQAYEDGTSAFSDHYACRFEKVNFFYFGGEEE